MRICIKGLPMGGRKAKFPSNVTALGSLSPHVAWVPSKEVRRTEPQIRVSAASRALRHPPISLARSPDKGAAAWSPGLHTTAGAF